MKRKYPLGKLSTNSGSSSVLLVIFFAGLIVFVFMPILAISFEKTLINLLYEDIQETVSLNTYQVYQHMDIDDLGKGKIDLKEDAKFHMTQLLNSLYDHPQLDHIEIIHMAYIDDEIIFNLFIQLMPSLYRDMYHLDQGHEFIYRIEMPMDRKDT